MSKSYFYAINEQLEAVIGSFRSDQIITASVQAVTTSNYSSFSLPSKTNRDQIASNYESSQEIARNLGGVIFCDGDTINGIMTIYFKCTKEPPQPFSKDLLKDITLNLTANSGHLLIYITEYSYCFYPISALAKNKIGYFRYDFHPMAESNGDLGGHPYFHMHIKPDGDTRIPTRPMDQEELEDLIGFCEYHLAPEERKSRHLRWLRTGQLEKLFGQLTPKAIHKLAVDEYGLNLSSYRSKSRLVTLLSETGIEIPTSNRN